MLEELKQQTESFDKETESLQCPQLRELLEVKLQQVKSLQNDVEIFNKFIGDLTEEYVPLESAYSTAQEEIKRAQSFYDRADDILHRCFMRGGSHQGECIREENSWIEALNALQAAKEKGKSIGEKLQQVVEERNRYTDLLADVNDDIRKLRREIAIIRKKMKERNCV